MNYAILNGTFKIADFMEIVKLPCLNDGNCPGPISVKKEAPQEINDAVEAWINIMQHRRHQQFFNLQNK